MGNGTHCHCRWPAEIRQADEAQERDIVERVSEGTAINPPNFFVRGRSKSWSGADSGPAAKITRASTLDFGAADLGLKASRSSLIRELNLEAPRHNLAVRELNLEAPRHNLSVRELNLETVLDDAQKHACDGPVASSGGVLGFDKAENEVSKVYFDPLFDIFNPTEQRIEALRVPSHVMHCRLAQKRKKEADDTPSTSSRSPCLSLDSSWAEPGSPTHSADGLVGQTKPVLQRAASKSSKFNEDNVTNWGVLVAKMLHCRVTGIPSLMQAAVRQRRRVAGAHGIILTSVKLRASTVVNKTRALCKKVGKETMDWFDSEWAPKRLLKYLFTVEYGDALILIANGTRKLLSTQPVVAEVQAPCKVFGDIHGQLRDMLLLFSAFGFPGDEGGPIFIFNGDFVDRGCHQLEVIGVLMALKITFPTQVYLVRGNHEDMIMNERYGFKDVVLDQLGKSGPKAYESMQRVFDELPLACVINDEILVVHGGIGDGKWSLDELRAVKKPVTGERIQADRMIFNVLWSDPIEEDGEEGDVFGVHASPRTGAHTVNFGWNVTKTFCARNGLSLVIRSHQSKQDSLGLDVMHDQMLMRVFSARDYEGHDNDAAILQVDSRLDEVQPLGVRLQVLTSVAKMRNAVAQQLVDGNSTSRTADLPVPPPETKPETKPRRKAATKRVPGDRAKAKNAGPAP